MTYLQSTDNGAPLDVAERGAANTLERLRSPAAIRPAAPAAGAKGSAAPHADRVTLSPEVARLVKAGREAAPQGAERLAMLADAIKQQSLPIYPQAIAEAILQDEGLDQAQPPGGRAKHTPIR